VHYVDGITVVENVTTVLVSGFVSCSLSDLSAAACTMQIILHRDVGLMITAVVSAVTHAGQ